MSHFSSIGFPIETEKDFEEIADSLYMGDPIWVPGGKYIQYQDVSEAELWLQINQDNELIGVHPHFEGISRRKVCLVNKIKRDESGLDRACFCWAEPQIPNQPESGLYPFVFDLPNGASIGDIKLPQNFNIQLTAFAHSIEFYDSEIEFQIKQATSSHPYSPQAFSPKGMFAGGIPKKDASTAQAMFTGRINYSEQRVNQLTGEPFWWLHVSTYGGEIDVVCDARLVNREPVIDGIIKGEFWLSGKLLKAPVAKLHKPFQAYLNTIRKSLGPIGNRHFSFRERWENRIRMPYWLLLGKSNGLEKIYKNQRKLFRKGQVVWANAVQANTNLFRAGAHNAKASVVYSLDPYFEANPDMLIGIARRLYRVKNQTNIQDASLIPFQRALQDPTSVLMDVPLPLSFTNNRTVLYTNVMVHRKHLPGGILSSPLFPIFASPNELKTSIIVPYRYWSQKLIKEWEARQTGGGMN